MCAEWLGFEKKRRFAYFMSFLRFRVSQLLDYSKLSLRTPETQPDSMSPPRFARTLMRPRERRRLAGPSSCRRALSQTARLPSAPRNTGREPGVGGDLRLQLRAWHGHAQAERPKLQTQGPPPPTQRAVHLLWGRPLWREPPSGRPP